MALELKSQEKFVSDEIQSVQAQAGNQFTFPIGSIVRALVEAHGRTALWLESLAQYVLARTRLATSIGNDVDTFVQDFGLFRLPGVAASGAVVFSSFSATQERVIAPFTSTVTTPDGAVTFQVTIDTTNPYWVPSQNSYVIPVNTFLADVPVIALKEGIQGNVAAHQISIINSPIVGIDTVDNEFAFDNGKDAQTDAQLRKYFVDYLGSLSRATLTAIQFAIETVEQGLVYTIVENIDYTTQAQRLGYFYAIVDDGSGSISTELYDNIVNSIEQYRGLTIMFEVQRPILLNANIAATINLPSGFSSTTLIAAVESALTSYIDSIPMGGGTLFYSRLFQVIYNVILSEINNDNNFLDEFSITGLTINSSTSDLVSNAKQSIRPGTYSIVTNP